MRFFLRALFLLCIATVCNAQMYMMPLPSSADILHPGSFSRIRWGPEIGLNYDFFGASQFGVANALADKVNLIGTDNDIQKSLGGVGFLAGAAVDIALAPNIGLLGSIHYEYRSAGKSADETVSGIVYSTNPLMLVDTVHEIALQSVNVTLTYLTLNPAVLVNVGEIYVFAGPSVGFPLWGTASFSSQLPDEPSDPLYYNYGTPQQSRSITVRNAVPAMKTRVALDLGVGKYFQIARGIFLAPELDIDYALTAINNTDAKMSSIQMILGLRFQ